MSLPIRIRAGCQGCVRPAIEKTTRLIEPISSIRPETGPNRTTAGRSLGSWSPPETSDARGPQVHAHRTDPPAVVTTLETNARLHAELHKDAPAQTCMSGLHNYAAGGLHGSLTFFVGPPPLAPSDTNPPFLEAIPPARRPSPRPLEQAGSSFPGPTTPAVAPSGSDQRVRSGRVVMRFWRWRGWTGAAPPPELQRGRNHGDAGDCDRDRPHQGTEQVQDGERVAGHPADSGDHRDERPHHGGEPAQDDGRASRDARRRPGRARRAPAGTGGSRAARRPGDRSVAPAGSRPGPP